MNRLRLKNMKIFLMLFLVLMLLGCSQTEKKPSSTQVSTPKPAPTAQATPTPQPSKWRADGVVSAEEYTSFKGFGDFKIYWTTDSEFIYMAIEGKTKGWVAIGFAPTTAMKDADLVIGWVENGKAKVIDAYSTGSFGPHPPDEKLGGKNDLIEIGGKEENGMTVVEFKRALVTGDNYDKILTPSKSIKIIWAMANEDNFNQKHNVAKGKGEITI